MDISPSSEPGLILKNTRENRKLSINRVAEDTNIGPDFLLGLENGDYSAFPGEPYIIGFLRNYAEYLDLDPAPFIAEYKSRKKENIGAEASKGEKTAIASPPGQLDRIRTMFHRRPAVRQERTEKSVPIIPAIESPLPAPASADSPSRQNAARFSIRTDRKAVKRKKMALRLRPDSETPIGIADSFEVKHATGIPAILPILAILAIAGIAVTVFFMTRSNSATLGIPGVRKPVAPAEYRMEGSAFEKRIYPGDSILGVVNAESYKLRLQGITDTVNLETPLGMSVLMLGEESNIDFNKDKLPEIKLTVGDFSKKEAASGALVRIEYVAQKSPDSTAGTDITVGPNDIQNAEPTAQKSGILFRSGRGPYPFVATVTFRASCMFRYEADRRDWKERYYAKGETITVNADNSLIVWASNAQAAKITIMASGGKTADLELGAPGEVAVKRIGWSQSEGSWVMSAMEND